MLSNEEMEENWEKQVKRDLFTYGGGKIEAVFWLKMEQRRKKEKATRKDRKKVTWFCNV